LAPPVGVERTLSESPVLLYGALSFGGASVGGWLAGHIVQGGGFGLIGDIVVGRGGNKPVALVVTVPLAHAPFVALPAHDLHVDELVTG
jgi:hypothetical protein